MFPPVEARGPERFRFEELDPGDFEELCFLLARLDDPAVRRLRAPDGGLDAALFDADEEVALRGWQAKRRRSMDWTDMEGSLATAIDRHRVRRVTFCFPIVLTAGQRQRFAERLKAAHPVVELDYWDAGELAARLLDPAAEEVRRRFFRHSDSRSRPPLNREGLRPLNEVDWHQMGVARGAFLGDEDGWTTKLERAADLELSERLADWNSDQPPGVRFVVLSGPPGSGKTRVLLDALREGLPAATLVVAPANAGEAQEIVEGWHRLPEEGPPTVLWLDDIERFLRLDETGITRDALLAMIGRDPRLLVAATCHGKGLSLLPPGDREIDTLLDTVVDCAGLHLRLTHRLSEAELSAAEQTGTIDSTTLIEIAELGVGPYVLAIERLRDRVARVPSPNHRALVEAALDWTACGIPDPVKRPVLRELWERRLPGEPSDQRFLDALDWAQEPVVGTVALMTRDEDGYYVPPLLGEEHRADLDLGTVAAILDLADEGQAQQLASVAVGSATMESAITTFAENGEGPKVGTVACAFGVALISSGKRDLGVDWLWRAAAEDDVQAHRNIGIALYRQGKMKESMAALERADSMGDAMAANGVGAILLAQEKEDEALEAFERAGARGDATGACNLAMLLLRRGDEPGAREAYRQAIDRGSAEAATALGVLIGNEGDHDGALELFRLADERGEREGSCNLGLALQRAGDHDGALAAYARADERGDAHGAMHLGLVLLDDDLDGALQALNRADDRGSAEGADVLGQVLGSAGLLDYAEDALRRADQRGSAEGALHLGDLLDYWDAEDEAEAAYRRADQRGAAGAAEALGMLLHRNGDPGATEVLERADEAGGALAAVLVAEVHREAGDLVAAEQALRRALDRGSADAGQALGELFLFGSGEPRHEDALEALTRSDELGSADGAFLHALLLAEMGRGQELVDAALKRADERGSASAAMALGQGHQERGEMEAALACFSRAEQRGEPSGALGAADLFRRNQMAAEAIEAARRALAAGLDEVAISLSQQLAEGSDFKAALDLLEEAVTKETSGAEQELAQLKSFIDGLERDLRGKDDPESRFQLAAVLHRSGRLEEAVAAYEVAAREGDAEAAVQMGNILSELGELDRAIEAYRSPAARESGKAAFVLGFKLEERGDEAGARAAWARADELGDGGGACRLGTALKEAGEAEAAKAAFQRAIEHGHAHAGRMHAELLRSEGELAAAAEQLRLAEAMGDGRAARELGDVLAELGDADGALQAYLRADRRGEAAGAYELGRLLLGRREVPEAIAALRRAEGRGHEAAMYLLTETLTLTGRSRDGERIARRWHERGSGRGSLQLAGILTRRQQFDEIGELDQAIRTRLRSTDGMLEYMRGWMLFLAGHFEEAVEPLKIAVAAGATGAEHITEFLELETQSDGGKSQMLELYERDNPFAARAVGESALEAGNLDLAEKALRRAFRHGGRDVGEKLAGLLDDLEEPEEARAVRAEVARLSLYDDPVMRPLQETAEQGFGAQGLEWLHAETLERSAGFGSTAGDASSESSS